MAYDAIRDIGLFVAGLGAMATAFGGATELGAGFVGVGLLLAGVFGFAGRFEK